VFATRGGRVGPLPLAIFVLSLQTRNVGLVSLLGTLMTGGEVEDPFAPSDVASGKKSKDSRPPGGSPRGGERVAPLSQGGGEVRGARRSSLFVPPASPVGTRGVHPPAGATTVRSDTVKLLSDASTPFGTRLPDVAGRTDHASRAAAGELEPRPGSEPAGKSSSHAPRDSLSGLVSVAPA